MQQEQQQEQVTKRIVTNVKPLISPEKDESIAIQQSQNKRIKRNKLKHLMTTTAKSKTKKNKTKKKVQSKKRKRKRSDRCTTDDEDYQPPTKRHKRSNTTNRNKTKEVANKNKSSKITFDVSAESDSLSDFDTTGANLRRSRRIKDKQCRFTESESSSKENEEEFDVTKLVVSEWKTLSRCKHAFYCDIGTTKSDMLKLLDFEDLDFNVLVKKHNDWMKNLGLKITVSKNPKKADILKIFHLNVCKGCCRDEVELPCSACDAYFCEECVEEYDASARIRLGEC